MSLVIVERSFPEPKDFDEIQALENAVQWCLEQYRVRFEQTFFSKDRRHMVCLYDAPDAEAVRETQKTGGLPYDRIWSGKRMAPPRAEASAGGLAPVVVQRAFEEPIAPERFMKLFESAAGCLALHRAELHASVLSTDGNRMVCYFEAVDAESVRIANKQAGIPYTRAWLSTIHRP